MFISGKLLTGYLWGKVLKLFLVQQFFAEYKKKHINETKEIRFTTKN